MKIYHIYKVYKTNETFNLNCHLIYCKKYIRKVIEAATLGKCINKARGEI